MIFWLMYVFKILLITISKPWIWIWFSLTLPLFRTVYHCPSCNLCRLGKGLGIDFFHCMTCNCCLGIQLLDHKCREKGLETNCPICCEFMFTSSETVRDLPCGHYMHSACFQVYPLCPILDSFVICWKISIYLYTVR